jgi:hypothetical protein
MKKYTSLKNYILHEEIRRDSNEENSRRIFRKRINCFFFKVKEKRIWLTETLLPKNAI